MVEEHTAEILKELLDGRKKIEIKIAEERKCQEETLEKLLICLRDPARTRGIDPGASVDSGEGRLHLNILTEGDNIEGYLTTFERLMLGYGVEKNRWSYSLAPNLTGKAQQVFAALPAGAAGEYDQLKEAILKCYD